MASRKTDIILVLGASLPSQPWWPKIHSTIIAAFLHKDISAFPPTWTRLNTDLAKGAQGLAQELGANGHLAVAFVDGNQPVACGGVLPFRGNNWIDEVEQRGDEEVANRSISTGSESVLDWEICCFCVDPSNRGQGLSHGLLEALIAFVKVRGAQRLICNHAEIETGDYWLRQGFELIPGAGGVLRKGFKADPEKEGLREDIHFRMGVKSI